MDFFKECGITPFINAHDTYTVYGGSRMAENTLEAMKEISRHFVDMEQLQRNLGSLLARMTGNEGAYITNGAAGGLLLAACVCMAEGSLYKYTRLPRTEGMKNEIIVMRAQRNAYDAALWAGGAVMVEIGDADETLEYELEGSINERTAAVFYFVSSLYERGSMELSKTIEIAHRHNVPVVVDAAAQLPPAENLWKFTKEGADLVIFSGGKTLCGPQDSGLIVGRRELIEDCVRFGAPAHGICRFCKTSRESMAGLYVAVKDYLEADHVHIYSELVKKNEIVAAYMAGAGLVADTVIVNKGPVGQNYPRLFLLLKEEADGERIVKEMYGRGIYIGYDKGRHALSVSPLNLTEEEADVVGRSLKEVLEGTG
ncbi:MAG: aminotransferase class V-fold PLP-dependent enzyme [Lachnospiraceae bacterium]|nr:aminotransferase class V-fold PLP-dependent enzyme [Lachnospiraceae bacterium]